MPERDVWPFAQQFLKLKERILRIPPDQVYEAKGTKLLNRRVFQQARLAALLPDDDRARAVEVLLRETKRGNNPTFHGLLALAQAKLAFVHETFDLADSFGMKVFASIVPRDAPQQRDRTFLRKDFAYLFQRIHSHVCDGPDHEHGVLIFDEQDPALSQSLLDQIHRYFVETERGKQRAARMIPMPFFVHSDLTPAIQLADLVAYTNQLGLEDVSDVGTRSGRTKAVRRQGLRAPIPRPRSAGVEKASSLPAIQADLGDHLHRRPTTVGREDGQSRTRPRRERIDA